MTSLRGKKRKKGKKFASDETNWFDEGGDDGDVAATTTTEAPTTPTIQNMATNSAAALQEGAARLAAGGSNRKPGDDLALDSITDDDLLVKDGGGGSLHDGKVVLEPVVPLVEAYGLPSTAGTDMTSMDDLERETIATTTTVAAAMKGGAGAGDFARMVEQESGRNDMEVPDDDMMLGEGLKMGRGLDDMLMERSIRFYDPKVGVQCVCVECVACCALMRVAPVCLSCIWYIRSCCGYRAVMVAL